MNVKRYKIIVVILAVLCISLAGILTYQWYGSSKPTSSETTTEQQYNQNTDIKYVASKESDKFHREDCKFAKNIKKSNLVTYETIEEAENSGRRPCSECNP